MATRFIATNECDAHENFKQMILKAKKEDIVYVKSPAGFPGRAIKNEFVKRTEQSQIKAFQIVWLACFHALQVRRLTV